MNVIDSGFSKYWERNTNITTLLGLQLGLKIIIGLFIVFLISWLTLGFFKTFSISWIWNNYYDEIIKLIILSSAGLLIYSLISFALQSYNHYAHFKIDRLRHERQQIELQYEALKNQLSPHYLFNCLNTISSLIHHNARQTEDFIRRMAKTFQYVLTNDQKKVISIAEEVEFVKAYNYLLKVRFENQLILDINLSKTVFEGYIPPLTLQMLLENVVKHNIIDDQNKITVSIYSPDEKVVIIENNKTIAPQSPDSFQIGLENIKKRYQHLIKMPVKVKDEDTYTVILPIVYLTEEEYV